MLVTAQMRQMPSLDFFSHAPGAPAYSYPGNKEHSLSLDGDAGTSRGPPTDCYSQLVSTLAAAHHVAHSAHAHARDAKASRPSMFAEAAAPAVDDSLLEPYQCLAALSEIAATFQPARAKPANQHDGEAHFYDVRTTTLASSRCAPGTPNGQPAWAHDGAQRWPCQPKPHGLCRGLGQGLAAVLPQGTFAFQPSALAADAYGASMDVAPPDDAPSPTPRLPTPVPVAAAAAATSRPGTKAGARKQKGRTGGRGPARAASKSDKQLRKAPASRRQRAPASPRAAGLAEAKAVQIEHLPKRPHDYKEGDGQWTTFLTSLPTVALNAFLKISTFTKADIASLKKERRKRKCNVYTRRFRNKKAAKETHRPAAAPPCKGAKAGRRKRQQTSSAT